MIWQKRALLALHTALEDFEHNESWGFAIEQAKYQNRWFEEAQVHQSLSQWRESLSPENVDSWLSDYSLPENIVTQRLGIIMAGNVPLVGFHDVIVGVISGFYVFAKTSSDDTLLPKMWLAEAAKIDPIWSERVEVVEQLRNLDIAIATGSNNTAKYFASFFKSIPHLIRNNRNSVAVLTGEETQEDFIALGHDVFDYFGLGCRNVTHLMLPVGYDFTPLFQCWDKHFDWIRNHNKYANNYEYHRALLLMNLDPHIDTGYLIAKEKPELYAPVGMLNYSFYDSVDGVAEKLVEWGDSLQCTVSHLLLNNAMNFGSTQCTQLYDFADGVDTLNWLIENRKP
jgi:hypothetical protein